MSDADSVETFPAMLRRVLSNRLKPGVEAFPDMFAADGVMELPFAPPGFKTPLERRDAIAAHFQMASKLIKIENVAHVVTHGMSDPELVLVEFSGFGRGLATGEPYEQRYISLIRVRDGHIVHYKDYWNPIAVLRTLKGEEVMKAFAVS